MLTLFMHTTKLNIVTREFLVREYVDKMKPCSVIAKEIGCSPGTIKNRLKAYGIQARPCHQLKYDLADEIFGKLTAMRHIKNKGWECRCECGNIIVARTSNLRRGEITTCTSTHHLQGANSLQWKGYGEISGHMVCKYRVDAKKRKIPFKLSAKYLWHLFVKQQSRCAISGVTLILGKKPTASLDRIDSSKGYAKGNVQWVHKTVNTMKWDFVQQDFIAWCKTIAAHHS